MKRIVWWLLSSIVLLTAGVGLGWQIRGAKLQAEAQELSFMTELDRITIYTANLDLISSNRLATARRLSESRLYETLKRADDLVQSGFRFRDVPTIPNLTDSVRRAASYARANAAAPEAVKRADRLYAWLQSQQGPAT